VEFSVELEPDLGAGLDEALEDGREAFSALGRFRPPPRRIGSGYTSVPDTFG
jgi:hypothetical protein